MKKEELLRDTGIMVGIWVGLLLVIFAVPGVQVSTKYLLAGVATGVTIFAFPMYFGWEKIRANPSLIISTGLGIVMIGLFLSLGFLLDTVGLVIWNWVYVNGVAVVTWVDLLAGSLVVLSGFLYYLVGRTMKSISEEWREFRQERAEKAALRQMADDDLKEPR